MSIYILPIFYEHAGKISIEAESEEDAIRYFKDGDYNEDQIDDVSLHVPDGPWMLDEEGDIEVGNVISKLYCTQNNGDCPTCSLVNYGRDCMNNLVNRLVLSRPIPPLLRVISEKDCCPRDEFLPGFINKVKRFFGTGGCRGDDESK